MKELHMLDALKYSFINSIRGKGKIICIEPGNQDVKLESTITLNQKPINEMLLTHGGILFRGFEIQSITQFESVSNFFVSHLSDYNFRSTPRTKIEGKIFTSTEYPADRFIQFHNECSYSTSWPARILFFCVIPSNKGGETALADSREVYKLIDENIKNEFISNGLTYVRNYIPGLDMDWSEVFQTNQRSEVEKYCLELGVNFEWGQGNIELTTKQHAQAAISHPTTKETAWFNQAHLFHSSALQQHEKEGLLSLVRTAENLPRNVFLGSNKAIDDKYFDNIRAAYETERIEFQWQKGDVLLLDNLLMAHSRNPYEGNRKIAVAMG